MDDEEGSFPISGDHVNIVPIDDDEDDVIRIVSVNPNLIDTDSDGVADIYDVDDDNDGIPDDLDNDDDNDGIPDDLETNFDYTEGYDYYDYYDNYDDNDYYDYYLPDATDQNGNADELDDDQVINGEEFPGVLHEVEFDFDNDNYEPNDESDDEFLGSILAPVANTDNDVIDRLGNLEVVTDYSDYVETTVCYSTNKKSLLVD